MSDYRLDYIEKKMGKGFTAKIDAGKLMIVCGDGFEFEARPMLPRSLNHYNEDKNELTTVTSNSISVRKCKQKPMKQMSLLDTVDPLPISQEPTE